MSREEGGQSMRPREGWARQQRRKEKDGKGGVAVVEASMTARRGSERPDHRQQNRPQQRLSFHFACWPIVHSKRPAGTLYPFLQPPPVRSLA